MQIFAEINHLTMKRYIYQSLFCMSLALYLTSCSTSLHRGIPRGERHQRTEPAAQVVVDLPEEQTLAVSETETSDPIIRESEAPAIAAVTTPETDLSVAIEPANESSSVNEIPSLPADGGDTLVITEEQLDEAMRSEKLAKTAQVFSFLPIAGIVFFPMILVGLIGTLVCIAKINKYEYVTEDALRRKRAAGITVAITSIVVVLLFVFALLLILALL